MQAVRTVQWPAGIGSGISMPFYVQFICSKHSKAGCGILFHKFLIIFFLFSFYLFIFYFIYLFFILFIYFFFFFFYFEFCSQQRMYDEKMRS